MMKKKMMMKMKVETGMIRDEMRMKEELESGDDDQSNREEWGMGYCCYRRLR
jgi:hypothetical protein